VVVANDQMALGLIAGLHARGVDVPGDVSIAGFDDNPDAAYYRPALTTVRLDIAGEARHCVGAVLGDAEPPTPEGPVLVPRASTAPPRA
jgi:DNA-binding LacI/PurR family transcriptional regulator